ncbi:hypothetical protein ASE00_17855 [Sphingomonas sp. Root710]|uniref:hypothetical protein n=1 Tax=Sphingomonas sp. Root710 TaxID=1736594 RepID=UPI0006F8730C|nr:hypothetical protein [Sphingomonas sp. Root710]KRB80877.1 hypothetical protein ASE00_17855 [Sphingomonas sp. Root710]
MIRQNLSRYDVDAMPLMLDGAALAGLWTLRFGLFGCRDDETHGGVLHVEGDRMAGGDGQLIFHGRFTLDGTTLTASLSVVRHGSGTGYAGVFGTLAPMFQLDVVADAITADLFEGRIVHRAGGEARPEIRVVMRRFEPMSDRSQII